MTTETVETKKPKVLGKAQPDVEIPAWTKKLLLPNPDSGKEQPLSWYWRRLPEALRAAMEKEYAAVSTEIVDGKPLAQAASPTENAVAVEEPIDATATGELKKLSRKERREALRRQRNAAAV